MAKPPAAPSPHAPPAPAHGAPQSSAVQAFLDRVRTLPQAHAGSGRRGRLMFAIDATASRQPTWDRACALQGEMFAATRDLGGLEIQLAYYRGYKEFAATPFLADAAELTRRMAGVRCLGGQTQIGRVLEHALAETRRIRVNALVFVGDAVEEAVDPLAHLAGQLGLHGTPCFLFQEGGSSAVADILRQLATLSGGAWAPFDAASAGALRDLLRAVAVFAAGGTAALARLPGGTARAIAGQLPAPKR